MSEFRRKRSIEDFRPLSLSESALIGELGQIEAESLECNIYPHRKIIRAEILECIILDNKICSEIFSDGVFIRDYVIIGDINISGRSVYLPFVFENCLILGCLVFIESEFKFQFNLIGTSFWGLLLDGSKFIGSLNIIDCQVFGYAALRGISVGGDLLFNGTKIYGDDKDSSIILDGSHVKGKIHFQNSESEEYFYSIGGIRLSGVSASGEIGFRGADIYSGIINLKNCRIDGVLFLDNIKNRIKNSNFTSLICKGLCDDDKTWGESNHFYGFQYNYFSRNAYANYRIKWLVCQVSEKSKDSPEFSPQPWKYLKRVLIRMGHENEACLVGIAYEEERRKHGSIGAQPVRTGVIGKIYALADGVLHALYGYFTGYGYKPLKLVVWLFGLWVAFGGIYSISAQRGYFGPTNPLIFQNEKYTLYGWREQLCIADIRDDLKSEPPERSINWYYLKDLPAEYTGFSPFGFSLDLLLPVVDLMQDKDWGPLIPTPEKSLWQELKNFSPPHWIRIAMWVETLIGWFISLLIVAVISGMARNTRDDE